MVNLFPKRSLLRSAVSFGSKRSSRVRPAKEGWIQPEQRPVLFRKSAEPVSG